MDDINKKSDSSNKNMTRVIAVTSGKGGVGKTNVSVNLAVSLANRGDNVMLMDADLGLANVNVLLGLKPEFNIYDLIDGNKSLDEILIKGPSNVMIVPASSGIQRMANLSNKEHAGLINIFSDYNKKLDTLIIDTAAGISDSVVSFSKAANEVLVVVCDEPASITDAYALIKVLYQDHNIRKFHILSNMVQSMAQGKELFNKLTNVAERFLDITLDYAGIIPIDEYLRKSVQKQWAVANAFPRSRSAIAFSKLADAINSWPINYKSEGHLEFFFEKLVQV